MASITKNSENKKQACKFLKCVSALGRELKIKQNSSLILQDGSLNRYARKWQAILACTNYWEREVPLIANRANHIQRINALSTDSPDNTEVLQRYLCTEEMQESEISLRLEAK